MEPLAGFYVLFGILFDVLGAYLIVSNIISYKSIWNPKLRNMSDVFNQKIFRNDAKNRIIGKRNSKQTSMGRF